VATVTVQAGQSTAFDSGNWLPSASAVALWIRPFGAPAGVGQSVTSISVFDDQGALIATASFVAGVNNVRPLVVPVLPDLSPYSVQMGLSGPAAAGGVVGEVWEFDQSPGPWMWAPTWQPINVQISGQVNPPTHVDFLTPQHVLVDTTSTTAVYEREMPPLAGSVLGANKAGAGTNIVLLTIPANQVWKGTCYITAIAGAGAGFAFISTAGASVTPAAGTRVGQLDLSGNNDDHMVTQNIYVSSGANVATLVYTTSGVINSVDVGCNGILL
jgi:hypothetical protein